MRLEDARVLFERAHFFEPNPKTRAQWADTLAELAILRFREGLHSEGRAYLEQAKTLAAFRPKVLAANDADPGINQRAKLGIVIIICVLGFFAVRRLRQVWFGELTRVRRTRDSVESLALLVISHRIEVTSFREKSMLTLITMLLPLLAAPTVQSAAP